MPRRTGRWSAVRSGSPPASGRKLLTFLTPGEHLGQALPAASLERQRRVKVERDPGRVVRSNVSVLDVLGDGVR